MRIFFLNKVATLQIIYATFIQPVHIYVKPEAHLVPLVSNHTAVIIYLHILNLSLPSVTVLFEYLTGSKIKILLLSFFLINA